MGRAAAAVSVVREVHEVELAGEADVLDLLDEVRCVGDAVDPVPLPERWQLADRLAIVTSGGEHASMSVTSGSITSA